MKVVFQEAVSCTAWWAFGFLTLSPLPVQLSVVQIGYMIFKKTFLTGG